MLTHACRCLGWEGLCVEPLQRYHKALRANRSCTLVPECISAEPNSTLVMQLERHGEKHGSLAIAASTNSPQQRIRGSVDVRIRCNPLHEMLRRVGRTAVDLWSLDVEGHEPQVLGAVQWAKTPVSVLLAEAGTAKDAAAIDAVLAAGTSRLAMEHKLHIDVVYADRGGGGGAMGGALPAAKPARFWLQPNEASLAHAIPVR